MLWYCGSWVWRGFEPRGRPIRPTPPVKGLTVAARGVLCSPYSRSPCTLSQGGDRVVRPRTLYMSVAHLDAPTVTLESDGLPRSFVSMFVVS